MLNLKNLKNLKIRFLPFLVAGTMSFSLASCVSQENDKVELDSANDKVVETLYEEEKEEVNEYQKFIDYNNSIEPDYNHNEFYPTIEDVKKQDNFFHNDNECTYEFDGNVDGLVFDIIDNSKKFMRNNETIKYSDGTTDTLQTFDYDLEIKYNNIKEYLIRYLNKITKSDYSLSDEEKKAINEDICRIKDIVILFARPKDCLACFDTDLNAIIINEELIENDYGVSYYWKELEPIINHEINHARQYSCEHRKFKVIGSINKEEHIPFLMESSAESYLKNKVYNDSILYSDYDYNYYFERMDEAFILLLGLCHEGGDIDNYYNSIFESDLDKFYEFCGAETEKEKLQVNNILYSIDSRYARSDLGREEFAGKSYSNADLEVGIAYRVEIFKYVLNNIIKYTTTNDFSLEDNVLLFNIVKNYVVSDIYNSDIYESDPNCSKIEELEKNYRDFICEYYNLTLDELNDFEEKEARTKYDSTIQSDLYELQKNSLEINKKNLLSTHAQIFMDKFPILYPILDSRFLYMDSYNEYIEKVNTDNKDLVLTK